jgi:hypothetical protein
MSEHQRETEFLRHCISYDESPERQKLDQRLTQIERDERCVRRAVWLMSLLAALAVACLGYGSILFENFPHNTSHLLIKIILAMGLASSICLVAFASIRMVYRLKLDQRREECRQLVTTLLASRLGQPSRLGPARDEHWKAEEKSGKREKSRSAGWSKVPTTEANTTSDFRHETLDSLP